MDETKFLLFMREKAMECADQFFSIFIWERKKDGCSIAKFLNREEGIKEFAESLIYEHKWNILSGLTQLGLVAENMDVTSRKFESVFKKELKILVGLQFVERCRDEIKELQSGIDYVYSSAKLYGEDRVKNKLDAEDMNIIEANEKLLLEYEKVSEKFSSLVDKS